ncbi:MAG: ribosome maturation factor RimP [Epulopiscium sp.]|jgi:ribosome maturation factor RimP|uniref:Ribosome maturation factor RimP n=1 Tax=Defluviitalea raffinosedens TaxID=1450156 RepID=A0A7C8LGL8_9FIRM|nr:ribosome maturation factor RimP [Defluviitalea raffinosedens]MBZ4668579.1 rimP [Defluviitaleaceae bacterium]MDK2787189.1 ribosome maturation factor RimP [Candidatus Epulonipiscium sp.]KAE9637076.1 ribosome maturation factor RimP [Defluviitalea raffinosedens]MBM7685165.1 ribosome maturation factor RimP [Defluviitalea raffinosedens]HHW67395.1 ribosome maturation factor RimP [Candidatus Epulonipiscium sp.]
MSKHRIEQIVQSYLEPIMEEYNFELVDLEYVKEGANWYLRVFIDKEGGVTIDDCELVSKALEVRLDEEDPIENSYILEVSSPGLDRPLKKDSDFERYKGEIVDIKLYKPFNKKKEYRGELVGLKDNIVTIIDEDNNTLSFSRNDIAIIRLAILF